MAIGNIGLQEIHLDISTKLRQKTFYANEVDTEGRGLHAFLQDNGIKVDGTGVTMQFRYKSLNDGESKAYDFTPIGDPTNGEFEIHYPTEMVRGHGNKLFPCTIVARDSTSELAFENVFVYVNKAEVNTEGVEATNEYSSLKTALDKVDVWDSTFESKSTALDVTFQEKYDNLEAEYATDLTGVKSQLAEIVPDVQARIDALVIPISAENANIEVTDAHVSTAKNKTFTTMKNRLEEVELDTFSAIQNIVVNGNFASTSGWSPLYSTVAASGNILSATGSGANALIGVRRQYGNRIGHTYYAKAKFRYTGVETPSFKIKIGGTLAGLVVKNNADFHEVSGILTTPNDATVNYLQLEASFIDAVAATGKVIDWQYFIVIDLTQEFGAGKEPSKSEMDLLISKFANGWFDGKGNLVDPKINIETKLAKVDKKNNIAYGTLGERFENIEKKVASAKGIISEARTTVVQEQDSRIVYTGTWSLIERANTTVDGYSKTSKIAGDIASFKFYGDYIAVWLERSYIGGIAEIHIDGVKVADVDTYIVSNPGFSFPALERKLPFGEHEIKVIVSGNKNPASTNTYIYLDCFLCRNEVSSVTEKFQSGIIMTFDDSRNYITTSAPILYARGLKATCYVNPDIFNRLDSSDPMKNYEIQALKIYDWEITSHANQHESLTSITVAEAEQRILKSYQWLKSRGLDYTHFSAPYGQTNAEIDALIKKYHASNVLVGLEPVSFNPKSFDPYAIPRYQLQEDSNLTTLSTFLDTVKATNQTVVLCFHGVANGAVAPNMTYEKFNAALDVIQAKGMPIMRMKDFFGA